MQMVLDASLAPSARTAATSPAATANCSVGGLVEQLEEKLAVAISQIARLNAETKFVAINAKMEAARAGGASGLAFNVVAQAIQQVSRQTSDIAGRLANETRNVISELHHILGTRVKGEKLSDLALMNIDVIDRNLYERSCDVRWWATDASVIQACTDPTPGTLEYCSKRLGQILDSYTVYFDIVVTDLDGHVLTNGRPNHFHPVGTRHANTPWFRSAINSHSGNDFGFQSMHASPLIRDERCLVYSCGVRENGDPHGQLVGVIALLFRWDALAQTIVRRTAVSEQERPLTRSVICDSRGLILADSEEHFLTYLDLPGLERLLQQPKNYEQIAWRGQSYCVGHALAPSFETYTTGWHSLVIQQAGPEFQAH